MTDNIISSFKIIGKLFFRRPVFWHKYLNAYKNKKSRINFKTFSLPKLLYTI